MEDALQSLPASPTTAEDVEQQAVGEEEVEHTEIENEEIIEKSPVEDPGQ